MKRLAILVGSVSPQRDLAIVPCTRFLNPKVEKADGETLLRFQNGWRIDEVLFVNKCRLNLNTALGTFFMRYAFPGKTLADLAAGWDAQAISEGFGRNSYDLSDVLLLHTREYIKEIYDMEQEEKRKREEAVRKAAERQAWIESIPQQVQSGKFSHPSIKD